MKKQITMLAITIFFISACAPATALPTDTPTATLTATPVPTSTPTPTLEPWMISLPEVVESVELDGEIIYGLDSQGERVMQFDLDSGEWTEVITNIPKWLDQRTQDIVDELGYGSYQDLLDEKVMSQFIKERNKGYMWVDFFYESASVQVYVHEVRKMPDGTWVAVGAAPYTEHFALFELGYEDESGNYMPMVNHYHQPGYGPYPYDPKVKLNSPKSLEMMKGELMLFQLVYQYADWMDQGKKEAFLNGESSKAGYEYRDLVAMKTPAETEWFLERALSPDSSPSITMEQSSLHGEEIIEEHQIFMAVWGRTAKIMWALEKAGTEKPYIIVDNVMPNVDVDESKTFLFGG